MLGPIRKFSTSIYAKILLGIVIIPFVFWGMGSSFTGGSKNIVLVIDKEKFSTQEFVNYIQKFAPVDQKIDDGKIEQLMSVFVSEKLIKKEIEHFQIMLSDDSLSKLIMHQEEFKRENKFSRTEYEKFLIKNNIAAVTFEDNLSKNERKKQLIEFIGGGVSPSEFFVNHTYNKINQKRNVELINLNNAFKNELNFSDNEIKLYYETNLDKYKEIYKTTKILNLNPKMLTGNIEYDNAFFKKIDEIDDAIFQGDTLNNLISKFNLGKESTYTLNESGEDINSVAINNISEHIVESIFSIKASEPVYLIESNNKYAILELIKTESINKKLTDENVRKKVLSSLTSDKTRKLITKIISDINQNKFNKNDFDKIAKDRNVSIQKINLDNLNDNKKLKDQIIKQIYSFSEKKIIVAHDLFFTENYLIYIDKVRNVNIDKKSDDYKKYYDLSKAELTSRLFNTYDRYIKEKYKIDINYKALDIVKNYFN